MILKYIVIFSLVVLSGCASTPATPERFYDLSPQAEPRDVSSKSKQIILVGPVTIPEALKRPQILLRHTDGTYTIEENYRWAGALDESVNRVLGENLERLLGTKRVISYPSDLRARPDIHVLVSVRRFEPIDWREIVLDAQWQILAGDSDRPARVGSATYRLDANGSAANAVLRMSEALSALAQAIHDDLRGDDEPEEK